MDLRNGVSADISFMEFVEELYRERRNDKDPDNVLSNHYGYSDDFSYLFVRCL